MIEKLLAKVKNLHDAYLSGNELAEFIALVRELPRSEQIFYLPHSDVVYKTIQDEMLSYEKSVCV